MNDSVLDTLLVLEPKTDDEEELYFHAIEIASGIAAFPSDTVIHMDIAKPALLITQTRIRQDPAGFFSILVKVDTYHVEVYPAEPKGFMQPTYTALGRHSEHNFPWADVNAQLRRVQPVLTKPSLKSWAKGKI